MQKIIAGLRATTTNENEKSLQDIGKIYENFYNGIASKIQKYSDNPKLYAVYTNYQGDYLSGNYDFYLGYEVSKPLEDVANISIKLDKYQVFTFDFHSSDDTLKAWQEIWENKEMEREYSFDVEEYDFQNHTLIIYISVK